MPYKVIHYAYPTIVVGHSKTKARHTFFVAEDGSLAADGRQDLAAAKLAAAQFLSQHQREKTPSPEDAARPDSSPPPR